MLSVLSFVGTRELPTAPTVSKDWKKIAGDSLLRLFLQDKFLPKSPEFKEVTAESLIKQKKLSGGLTNTTLYFQTQKADGNEFIARVAGKGSEKFINRQFEAFNLTIAEEYGITAKIVYQDGKGDQIMRFLPEPTPMTAELFKDLSNIDRMAIVLHKMHYCGKQFANDIDVFDRSNHLWTLLQESKEVVLPKVYDEAKKTIDKLEPLIRAMDIKKVPCHNDTTPGNFLLSKGLMYLIDWEYSGNNDAILELANTSAECEFSKEQDLRMFKAYFGLTWDETLYQRFTLYKPILDLWVSLWAEVQLANHNQPDKVGELQELAKHRFENCQKRLVSDEFKNALDFFTAEKTHVVSPVSRRI